MRVKNLAAIVAVSSLMLASSPALSAPAASKLSLASIERAGATQEGESELAQEGLRGFLLVFLAGAAAGALIYSLIKGGDEEPVSP